MTLKRKIILLSSTITLILIFIYTPIRTGIIEQKYVESLVTSTEKIILSLSSFEKEKKLGKKNLSKFYSHINKKYPDIALVTIADKKNKILKAGKDEKSIKSNTTFDSIIDSFLRDEFTFNKKKDFLIRYYDQNRFYIFAKDIYGGKLLLVFPYKLKTSLIIQLMLEIALIILISIIFSSIIFIQQRKKNYKDEGDIIKIIKTEKDPKMRKSYIEKKPKEKEITKKTVKKEKKFFVEKSKKPKFFVKRISNLTVDTLNDYIIELFHYISENYKPDIVSLYISNEDSSNFNKIYELKGNVFIKIEDDDFNSIDIDSEISDELQKSSILIQEKCARITIPVIYRNSMLGIINILRDRKFKGPEIKDIKEKLSKIARPLSEHILLNDIVTEESSGLHSATYLKLKYSEHKKKYIESIGYNFAILCLSFSNNRNYGEIIQHAAIIKELFSIISRVYKDNFVISLMDEYFIILLPNTRFQDSENIAKKIRKRISQLKIKIHGKEYNDLSVLLGIASTENIVIEQEDLLDTAIKNLK